MSWETSGQISVTQNSGVVQGVGTLFSDRSRIGDALNGPDGYIYQITEIVNNTTLNIFPAYKGTTNTSASYQIIPVRGYTKKAADYLQLLVNSLADGFVVPADLPSWLVAGSPTPLSVGGTGGTDAATARANLGVTSTADLTIQLAGKLNSTDARLTNAREWSGATVGQLEAEAGAATIRRAWTSLRIRQAILGWWGLISSVAPAANKAVVSDSTGKLSSDWLNTTGTGKLLREGASGLVSLNPLRMDTGSLRTWIKTNPPTGFFATTASTVPLSYASGLLLRNHVAESAQLYMTHSPTPKMVWMAGLDSAVETNQINTVFGDWNQLSLGLTKNTALAALGVSPHGSGVITESSATLSTVVTNILTSKDKPLARRAVTAAASNTASVLSFADSCMITVIGDSLSSGSGLQDETQNYSEHLANSLFNCSTGGASHAIYTNLHEFFSSPYHSHTGQFHETSAGLSIANLKLLDSQSISISGRHATHYSLILDSTIGAHNAGTIFVTVNGQQRATIAVLPTPGVQVLPFAVLDSTTGFPITAADVVTLTFRSEDSVSTDCLWVSGVIAITSQASGPKVLKINTPGQTIGRVLEHSRVSRIVSLVDQLIQSPITPRMYLISLSTNDMFNGAENAVPSVVAANLVTLLTGLGVNGKSVTAKVIFVLDNPPPLAPFQDYWDALSAAGAAFDCDIIDLTQSKYKTHLLADGLHPDAIGHSILANDLCSALGVPYNPAKRLCPPVVFSSDKWDTTKGRVLQVGQFDVGSMDLEWWPSGVALTTLQYGPTRSVYVLGGDAENLGLPVELHGQGALVTWQRTPNENIGSLTAQHLFTGRRWIKSLFGAWGTWQDAYH